MTPDAWDDIENNPTYRDTNAMKRAVADLIEYCHAIERDDVTEALKHARFALFCSGPGLGKTHIVNAMFKKAGLAIEELSPASASALAYDMWRARQEKFNATMFDDVDKPLRAETIAGIMKGAFQSAGRGVVRPPYTQVIRTNEERRKAMSPRYNPSIPPPSFQYRLAHLWLSNKRLHTDIGRKEARCCDDFEALIDRGMRPYWIDSDPRNVAFYTAHMVLAEGIYSGLGLKLEHAAETWRYFVKLATDGHPRPNFRLAIDLGRARLRSDYLTVWNDLAREHDAPDEPRAIRPDDWTGRNEPDLINEFKKGKARKEEERRVAEAAAREARRVRERAEAAAAKQQEKERKAFTVMDVEFVIVPPAAQPASAPPPDPKPSAPIIRTGVSTKLTNFHSKE